MTDPKITAYVIALGEGLTSASTLRDPLSACQKAYNAGIETINPDASAGTTKRTP